MTEETTNTEETVTETQAEAPISREPDENGSMAHLFKAAYDKAGQEMPKEPETEEEKPKQQADADSDDDSEDDDAPEKEPRGRRAKREYEARKNLEAENARLKAEKEAYQKLLDSFKKPEEKSESGDDIDAYLTEKGMNPENFIDDEAKKAVYLQFKELEKVSSGLNDTKSKADQARYESALETTYASLPKESQEQFSAATNHVLSSEMAQLKMNYPDASDEDIKAAAIHNLHGAMRNAFDKGKNPLQFAWEYAQTIGFKPSEPSKPQTKVASINPDKLDTLRKAAGAPSVDVADTGGLNGGGNITLSDRHKRAFADLKEYAN